ncbi:MAG: hypothetical protein CVV44_21880 [Spirochaetae bacterium HGW-Spirochaetae-1]|jgi:hypothetical protein|nr:MAG: hypothetical protein CVV44_21880 [Spirochaetae bacterium HGW-Spirochaetae-1]
MTGHYEKNLAVLRNRDAEMASHVDRLHDDPLIEVVETKEGAPVPSMLLGEKKNFLHSRFDPEKEAERFMGEINTADHDLYIVMGFAFGYHVESLLKRISRDVIVLIIEKNGSLFRKALEQRDLAGVLGDSRVMILLDPPEDVIADRLKGKASKNVSFITHRGSHQVYSGYYGTVLEICRSYLSTKEVNIATLAKFEKLWSSNIARNIQYYADNRGVQSLYGKLQGIPAIVVAAGPSLMESLDFIERNRDRAVIICVDTAYRILLKRNIVPHFCIAVDPQVINARYFEGVPLTDTVLVADPMVHPSVFHLFRGRSMTTGLVFDMMKWIERICGDKGEMTHGGSVSTNAFDLARRLGCSPVYLTGQDLAFTGGLAHARGSYLDEQIHLRTSRVNNSLMFNRYQLTALPPVYVKGIRSEKVRTNQKMMIFLAWFQKRKDEALVNATCDGAFMTGIRHVSCHDINLEKRDIPVSSVIDGLMASIRESMKDAATVRKRLIDRINAMLRDLDTLIPHLEKAVGFSGKLIDLLSQAGQDQGKLDYILRKLSEIDRTIETKKEVKDMISLTSQRAIHTISEGYDIDASDAGLSSEVLVARRSRFLYSGLYEAGLFNRKILMKMRTMLGEEAS